MKKLLRRLVLSARRRLLAFAGRFDCVELPFGENLEALNRKGHFRKLREAGGITFYSYSGPGSIEQQQKLKPSIAYGFVDEKLFARFIAIADNNEAQTDLEEICANISRKLGCPPEPARERGGWSVTSWDLPKQGQRYLLMFNPKTKASKSVYYFTPLRPSQSEDALLAQA